MSRQINQPINQVKLTNVAVVRMNKGGKRFEIACYRNKVVDYRQGLEQDLSEVLQTERIFTNVSKGEFSKAKDLQKVFGTKVEEEIAKLILQKGQVQVSDKERSQQLEKTNAQVAEWIAKNYVHPTSERPYTISQIRHAMQKANFSVHPTKPLKRQYLDCVKLLQGIIPIQRAKMELLLLIPQDKGEEMEKILKENNVVWVNDTTKNANQFQQFKVLVDPSLYRLLNEATGTIPGSRIEIVTQIVTKQGDVNLEKELVDLSLSNPSSHEYLPSDGTQTDTLTSTGGGGGDHDQGNEPDFTINRRKQQKKAKKKNQKAKRRDQTIDTDVSIPKTDIQDQPKRMPLSAPENSSVNSTRKSCNTCGGFFDTPAAYRSHFKSDWHKFNQKLKLQGVPPISEKEFMVCDEDLMMM